MGKCLAGPIPIAPRAMKTAVPSYFPQLIDVLNLISGNCEPQFVYLIPVILKLLSKSAILLPTTYRRTLSHFRKQYYCTNEIMWRC